MPVEKTGSPKDQHDAMVLERLRRSMERLDLDALLVVRGENVCWLTHWWDPGQMSLMPEEENAWAFIPREGEPFGFGTGCVSWGMELPTRPFWLEKLYGFSMACFADEAASACGFLRDKGFGKGRIGVETDWLPHECFLELQRHLPEVEFVNSSAVFYQARASKSTFELGVIRTAIKVFDESFAVARDDLRRNKDITKAMRIMCAELGARGAVPGIIPTQQHAYGWLGEDSPDYARVRAWYAARIYDPDKELIQGDFCSTYQGYWVDRSIYEWLNPEKAAAHLEEVQATQDRLQAMQGLLNEAVEPGMTGRQSHESIARLMAERRMEFVFWFHGAGLNIHEPPVVGTMETPTDDVTWEVNSVACSEVFAEGILFEDMFVLGEKGWEPLNTRAPFVSQD